MPTSGAEEFGRTLVRKVRDAAIRSCDRQLDPNSRAPVAKRWTEALATMTPQELAQTVVADSVDEVIFHLLQTIDQGVLRLSYTTEEGEVIDLAQAGLGELSGWYMGSGGWRAQFSEQRFVDDFSDLAGGDLALRTPLPQKQDRRFPRHRSSFRIQDGGGGRGRRWDATRRLQAGLHARGMGRSTREGRGRARGAG